MDLNNVAYGAIAAWILSKVWDLFSGSHKEVIKVTQGLTIAIVELKAEIKSLNEKITEIPILKKDINSLGSKVRDLQKLHIKGD